MQKNEILLENQTYKFSILDILSLSMLTRLLGQSRAMHAMARFYSQLFERPFSSKQSVYVFYAQVLLLAVLFPVTMGLGWRVLFIFLFCQALRRSGLIR